MRSITLKRPKDTEPAETTLHEKSSPLQCCKATVDKATFARAVQDACLARPEFHLLAVNTTDST